MLSARTKNYLPTIVAFAMLILAFAIFFAPFNRYTDTYILNSSCFNNLKGGIPRLQDVLYRLEYVYHASEEFIYNYKIQIMTIFSVNLIIFVLGFMYSFIILFFVHKKPLLLIGNIVFLLSVLIFQSTYIVAEKNNSTPSIPHISFYLSILGIIALIIFLVLFTKYKKTAPPYVPEPRTPKPHKPTKAERIAELERQISELSAKQKDTD